MIPLPFLCAKSNNRTRGQFECDVTWFCFCFDFVRLHARCGCCSIVCWRGWGMEGRGGKGGKRGEFCLKLDAQGQGSGNILDVDESGGWGSRKLDNFNGRHMCIVP